MRNILRKTICILLLISLTGCSGASDSEGVSSIYNGNENYDEDMELARTTPYGKYPELVTYSLGKMTGSQNSNMPSGDTYEDNAYTRYLNSMLNIQNEDMFEASDDYDDMVDMAIATNQIPDIMVVSDMETLQELVNDDRIEDLSEVYESCASDKIKDIYNSYGDTILENVTFNGKLMALPETNIENGPSMIWLRKDWMDKLGLEEPKTVEDVTHIVQEFIEKDPGNNGEGNTVGLVCDTNLTGECGYSYEYQMDIIFASYGAYPKQWIHNDEGEVVYGSVQPEAKEALAKLNEMYEDKIIDNQFLLRTTNNIIDLILEGKCGSFFGPWWSPNNPLMESMAVDTEANWQPYMISTDGDGSVSYYSQNPSYKYVVVRKGYEHPEIAVKILSVLFDYIRYEDKAAEGMAEYFKLNVDPTARPLGINVDYNDALDRCYSDLTKTLDGDIEENSLEILEASYYDACNNYLTKENPTVEEWAAYTSRITACKLLNQTKQNRVESLYFGETETMKAEWWKLRELEKKTYLEIVTGEKGIDEFDAFVEEWNEKGGEKITSEVAIELDKYSSK